MTQQTTMPVRRVAAHRVEEGVDLRAPGAVLFVVGAAFLLVTMLAASMAPGYDFNAAAISDLGVIGETAAIFNGLLVVIGALNALGGYLLYRSHGRTWIVALFALAGIGAAGAGLMPMTAGAPHSLFALLAFVCFNLEAMAIGAMLPGPMRALSFLAGATGLAFVVLMVVGDSGSAGAFGAIGHGGTERMIVYPAMLWLMALGGYLMAARTEP